MVISISDRSKMTPRGAKNDFNDVTVKMISVAYFWPHMWLTKLSVKLSEFVYGHHSDQTSGPFVTSG